MNNLVDPHAVIVTNAGNVIGHLPAGFTDDVYRLFIELGQNLTVLW